jgi:hypothetical protein
MRCRTVASLGLLAVLLGPVGGMSAVARAGDPEQLVRQYLQDHGAQPQSYVIAPVTDDYVVDTFPDVALLGVFFRQYPITFRPPEGLAFSNVFYVQDGQVFYLTQPSDLEGFFFNQLAPVQTYKAVRDAGRSWLRLSEDFSQDLFFNFYKPAVTVADGVVTGMVAVKSGGTGQITATLTFDNAGQLVDVQESRDVVAGMRPR